MNALGHFPPRRQRGFMLAVVMVVLVAMMLSAVALLRSTDTNQLVSGNLAFRNSTVHSADVGVQAAVNWLTGVAGTAALNANTPASGYYAVLGNADMNFEDPALWTQCGGCSGVDGAGNNVSWIVQRLCDGQGPTASVNCAAKDGSLSGTNSFSGSGPSGQFNSPATHYYRITVRVLGARNTSTLTQAFVNL